eukprot:COSAG01_NODE_6395_length_3693_cov_2.142181_5_plen_571_part_01
MWDEVTADELEQWDSAGMFTSVQQRRSMLCPRFGPNNLLRVVVRCAFQPMRILITYLQVTSQLGAVLHIHYPQRFELLMHNMKRWLDVFGLLLSPECANLGGFEAGWVFRVVLLPCVLSVLALLHCVFVAKTRKAAFDTKLELGKQMRSNLFFVIFFVYPTVCNEAFSTFNCVSLDTATNGSLTDLSVLSTDDRVFCQDLHVWHFLSAIVIVGFGCGVPIAFGGLLVRKARQYTVASNTDNGTGVLVERIARELDMKPAALQYMLRDLALGSDLGFLLDAYKPQYLFWESCDILRKLALVGLVVVLGQGSIDQIMFAAALSFGFFGLQLNYKPYKIDHDNHFRLITEIQVFFTILIAFALHSNSTNDDVEVISEEALDWGLSISFLVCIPTAFLITVYYKVLATKKSLGGTGVKSAFTRLQLGLASVADRTTMDAYCERLRATILAESTRSHAIWMFCGDDDQFHAMPPVQSAQMETAYTRGEIELHLSTGEIVDFQHMQMAVSKHDNHLCALRRRVLMPSADTQPAEWSPMPAGLGFLRVAVHRNEDPELWQRVEGRVKDSLPAYRVAFI